MDKVIYAIAGIMILGSLCIGIPIAAFQGECNGVERTWSGTVVQIEHQANVEGSLIGGVYTTAEPWTLVTFADGRTLIVDHDLFQRNIEIGKCYTIITKGNERNYMYRHMTDVYPCR